MVEYGVTYYGAVFSLSDFLEYQKLNQDIDVEDAKKRINEEYAPGQYVRVYNTTMKVLDEDAGILESINFRDTLFAKTILNNLLEKYNDLIYLTVKEERYEDSSWSSMNKRYAEIEHTWLTILDMLNKTALYPNGFFRITKI